MNELGRRGGSTSTLLFQQIMQISPCTPPQQLSFDWSLLKRIINTAGVQTMYFVFLLTIIVPVMIDFFCISLFSLFVKTMYLSYYINYMLQFSFCLHERHEIMKLTLKLWNFGNENALQSCCWRRVTQLRHVLWNCHWIRLDFFICCYLFR